MSQTLTPQEIAAATIVGKQRTINEAELAEIIRSLREKKVIWNFHTKVYVSMINRMTGVARRYYSVRMGITDKEDEKTKKLASDLVHKLLKGDFEPNKRFTAEAIEYVHPIIKPTIAGLKHIIEARDFVTLEIECAARNLPCGHFVEEVSGFGWKSYGMLIGETGDLRVYGNPAKLWKRMGVGLLNTELPDGTIVRERQRKFTDAKKAIEAGYSPARRSFLWNIETSIMMQQTQRVNEETGEIKREAGPYRRIYDEYKARKIAENEALPEKERRTPKHINNMSTRYMGKRLLRDLWDEWQQLPTTLHQKMEIA